MAIQNTTAFGKCVELWLRQGKSLAFARRRPYDVTYFARILWRLEPVLSVIPNDANGLPLMDEALNEVNTVVLAVGIAVLEGDRSGAENALAKVLACASRHSIPLPDPEHVPLPAWAAD